MNFRRADNPTPFSNYGKPTKDEVIDELRDENARLRQELDEALYAVNQLQDECRSLDEQLRALLPQDDIPF